MQENSSVTWSVLISKTESFQTRIKKDTEKIQKGLKKNCVSKLYLVDLVEKPSNSLVTAQ